MKIFQLFEKFHNPNENYNIWYDPNRNEAKVLSMVKSTHVSIIRNNLDWFGITNKDLVEIMKGSNSIDNSDYYQMAFDSGFIRGYYARGTAGIEGTEPDSFPKFIKWISKNFGKINVVDMDIANNAGRSLFLTGSDIDEILMSGKLPLRKEEYDIQKANNSIDEIFVEATGESLYSIWYDPEVNNGISMPGFATHVPLKLANPEFFKRVRVRGGTGWSSTRDTLVAGFLRGVYSKRQRHLSIETFDTRNVVEFMQWVKENLGNFYELYIDTDSYDIGAEADEIDRIFMTGELPNPPRNENTLVELRNPTLAYFQQVFPNMPPYVVKDFIYQNYKDEPQYVKDLAKVLGNLKWKKEILELKLESFDTETQELIDMRQGGDKNPFEIPRDTERHAIQKKLITQGPSNEPIIVVSTPDGYELFEGWHRTIQSLNKWPQGYRQVAWIGYSGTTESIDNIFKSIILEKFSTEVKGDDIAIWYNPKTGEDLHSYWNASDSHARMATNNPQWFQGVNIDPKGFYENSDRAIKAGYIRGVFMKDSRELDIQAVSFEYIHQFAKWAYQQLRKIDLVHIDLPGKGISLRNEQVDQFIMTGRLPPKEQQKIAESIDMIFESLAEARKNRWTIWWDANSDDYIVEPWASGREHKDIILDNPERFGIENNMRSHTFIGTAISRGWIRGNYSGSYLSIETDYEIAIPEFIKWAKNRFKRIDSVFVDLPNKNYELTGDQIDKILMTGKLSESIMLEVSNVYSIWYDPETNKAVADTGYAMHGIVIIDNPEFFTRIDADPDRQYDNTRKALHNGYLRGVYSKSNRSLAIEVSNTDHVVEFVKWIKEQFGQINSLSIETPFSDKRYGSVEVDNILMTGNLTEAVLNLLGRILSIWYDPEVKDARYDEGYATHSIVLQDYPEFFTRIEVKPNMAYENTSNALSSGYIRGVYERDGHLSIQTTKPDYVPDFIKWAKQNFRKINTIDIDFFRSEKSRLYNLSLSADQVDQVLMTGKLPMSESVKSTDEIFKKAIEEYSEIREALENSSAMWYNINTKQVHPEYEWTDSGSTHAQAAIDDFNIPELEGYEKQGPDDLFVIHAALEHGWIRIVNYYISYENIFSLIMQGLNKQAAKTAWDDFKPYLPGNTKATLVGYDDGYEELIKEPQEQKEIVETKYTNHYTIWYDANSDDRINERSLFESTDEIFEQITTGGKRYWEDLSDEEQEQLRIQRVQELKNLTTIDYPIEATFMNERVTVLGPVERFSPYDKHPAKSDEEWKGAFQQMVKKEDGSRFIAMAYSLKDPSTGKPLLSQVPPRKEKPKFPFVETNQNMYQIAVQFATEVRNEMLDGGICSSYEINNGQCDEWEGLFAHKMNERFGWDFEKQVYQQGAGPHLFAYVEPLKMWFDAEATEGVNDWRKLPLYQKWDEDDWAEWEDEIEREWGRKWAQPIMGESLKESDTSYSWNGKNVVWENDYWKIAVDKPGDATYVTLWDEDNKRVGYLSTTEKSAGGLPEGRWLFISMAHIDKEARDYRLGFQMYRQLMKNMGSRFVGLAGYKPDIGNNKISSIYYRLGAKDVDDFYLVPNPNVIAESITNPQSGFRIAKNILKPNLIGFLKTVKEDDDYDPWVNEEEEWIEIGFLNAQTGKQIRHRTNNFDLPPHSILVIQQPATFGLNQDYLAKVLGSDSWQELWANHMEDNHGDSDQAKRAINNELEHVLNGLYGMVYHNGWIRYGGDGDELQMTSSAETLKLAWSTGAMQRLIKDLGSETVQISDMYSGIFKFDTGRTFLKTFDLTTVYGNDELLEFLS